MHRASSVTPVPSMVECYLLIRAEKISWLRFVLEGHDGLAILTTISSKTGLVRLQTLAPRFGETMRLVNALAADLSPFRSHLQD